MTKIIGDGHRIILIAAAIAIFVGLSGQSLRAATVSVGTCVTGGTHFATIQAAVNGVTAGSTIQVCPGNYPEQVVIKKNLTLTGVRSGTAQNPVLLIPAGGFVANTTSLTSGDPLAAQIAVESPATNVSISYIAVDGTGNNLNASCSDTRLIGIYYRNASGTLNYVVARNQAQNAANFGCGDSAGLGIFVQSSGASTPATVTIENSTVYGYQKNGITANETGTTVTINGNSVVGAGPVDIAQNGIQIAYGATGRVESNTVADDIYNGDPTNGAAAGILIYDSGGMTITGNTVTYTQGGIPIQTDGSQSDNNNTITSNLVTNTQLGDGIDLCSNGNTVSSNTVFSSGQSGIHLDSSCGSTTSTGNNNVVSRNIVNDACAGILLGTGTGNTVSTSNTLANVANTTLASNTCTTPTVVSGTLVSNQVASHGHASSPVRP
jgi:parallel beta-helix repeat protein